MPANSEVPLGERAGLNDRPGSAALRSLTARTRLSVPRPVTAGVFSSPLRAVLAEAVQRASLLLSEAAGKTAEEIRGQLEGIVELLPSLMSGNDGAPPQDSRLNVPRRFIDVLRREVVAALTAASSPIDAAEIVSLFAALEEAIRQSEMTSTGRFVARLSGTDSVEAVVEIAHDIRSPLSSILFLVDTIRRGQSGNVSQVQERQLGLVYGAALGLSTLSSDLIDAVRGERLVDGRPVPFSITEVILGVCAIVQPIGEEKSLPVNVSLPAVDGRIGYASAINRVLLNLTTNALRYTDSGSVSIGCTEHGHETVEFWVEDTGR